MSVRRLAAEQPESFTFTPELEAITEALIAKYPEGRQASAVVPLLWETQKAAGGWLSEPALRAVADRLGMAHIRVLEVATFYTMFNLAPVGKYFVQLCGTTPCMLRGSDDLKAVCARKIGEERYVSADGNFSWLEVECLGACTNAPMVQINDDYFEDLTAENFETLLDDLAAGRPVKIGPQNGRFGAEPEGGPTSLIDPALYAVKVPAIEPVVEAPVAEAAVSEPVAQAAVASEPEVPAKAYDVAAAEREARRQEMRRQRKAEAAKEAAVAAEAKSAETGAGAPTTGE